MPDPLFPGRLGLYLSMLHYGLACSGEFAREHYAFFAALREYLGELRGMRVLDLGCGKSCWLTLLLASAGARACGIDVELTSPGFAPSKYWGIARRNGVERALRTLAWDALFARPYYRELARVAPFALDFDRVAVRAYDGRSIPFPDDSFDVVVSHEVLEHVADPGVLVGELRRVLRPGGRTYLYVHNWTSVSGGHHIAWKHPDREPSRVVPPWDHLRGNRWPDVPSYLNRLREQDYRRLFESQFEILDWIASAEQGRALLTPAIRAELTDYSEHELLTKGFVIVATPARKIEVDAA
jgi:SAM-dependent methyltransferase